MGDQRVQQIQTLLKASTASEGIEYTKTYESGNSFITLVFSNDGESIEYNPVQLLYLETTFNAKIQIVHRGVSQEIHVTIPAKGEERKLPVFESFSESVHSFIRKRLVPEGSTEVQSAKKIRHHRLSESSVWEQDIDTEDSKAVSSRGCCWRYGAFIFMCLLVIVGSTVYSVLNDKVS